jgi:integrase
LWLKSGPPAIKSPKTLRDYGETWRAWVAKNPVVAQIAVTDVTPLHVSTWYGALRESGLAQSTLRKHAWLTRHIFRYAVTPLGLRSDNPAEKVPIPSSKQVSPGELPRLTEDQVWKLADNLPTPYSTLVLVGAYTGLRLGELFGLRTEHLNRSTHPYVISVEWQWDEHLQTFRRPKRDKTRLVPVTPALSVAMDKHLLQYPPSQNRGGLVFAASNGAPLRQSNFRNQVWYPALERAGLPSVPPHSLRRTFVDTWIDRGMSMSYVRDMAGHESITMTMNTYKGTVGGEKLSEAVLKASVSLESIPGLQQAMNGAVGVMQVIGTHRDGRIEMEGLHPDWVPSGDPAPRAQVLRLPSR